MGIMDLRHTRTDYRPSLILPICSRVGCFAPVAPFGFLFPLSKRSPGETRVHQGYAR